MKRELRNFVLLWSRRNESTAYHGPHRDQRICCLFCRSLEGQILLDRMHEKVFGNAIIFSAIRLRGISLHFKLGYQ